jgi:hypothetical protein
MVGLQYGFRVTATQTFITVPLAKLFELTGGEVSTTSVLCGSPLTAIVGLGYLNFFRIVLSPLLGASDYYSTIALVVVTLRSGDTLTVLLRPPFLVFGYSFLVIFLVFPACLNPMRQIIPRPIVLSILLKTITTVFAHVRPNTQLALSHAPVQVARRDVELGELPF